MQTYWISFTDSHAPSTLLGVAIVDLDAVIDDAAARQAAEAKARETCQVGGDMCVAFNISDRVTTMLPRHRLLSRAELLAYGVIES